MRGFHTGFCAVSLLALVAGAAGTATAQTGGSAGEAVGELGGEEIIVTAQKRAESIQSVPLSITALSGETLEAQGIDSFTDYATRIPNLAFGYTNSLGGTAQTVTIRGVFGQNTTGFYLDETPLPGSIDPRVIDLQRIEVLRGPQGTLYGARSMGGTVRLITRQPDAGETDGSVLGSVSTTAHGGENFAIDGVVNVPLIADTLALRASGFYDYQSGIFDRTASADAPEDFGTRKDVDSRKLYGGTIALGAHLLDGALTVTPRYAFQRGKTDGRALADIEADNFSQSRMFDIAEPGRDKWDLATLTAAYDTGSGTITSATAWFKRTVRESEDFSEIAQLLFGTPAIPAIMRASSRFESTTQELRYASDWDGAINLTAGVFYQDSESTTVFPPTPLPGIVDDVYSQDFGTDVEEWAAFGELTFTPAPGLRLIAGARVFENSVNFAGVQDGVAVLPATFSGKQKEDGINPKFGIQYDAARDVMLYASAAKGFRIGGVNALSQSLCADDLDALGISDAQSRSYKSDSLWSYEIGAKTRFADRRITLNGALFRVDWSNVQQGVSLACGFGLLVNAGEARSEGGELEMQVAATDALRFNMGAGYTDARITDGGGNPAFPNGARIQQVPRWTLNAGVDFEADLGVPVTFHADYAYVGQSFSRSNSPLNRRIRPSYTIVNTRITATIEGLELSLFADNLFDEMANLSDIPSLAIELPGRPRIVTNRPRTVGLEGRVRF